MSYYGKISVGWWAGSVAGPIDSNQKLARGVSVSH